MSTRRDFLATTSSALGSSLLGARRSQAQWVPLSLKNAALPPAAFLPEPISSQVLQNLASVAIDTAQRAGATYADVRIAEQVRVGVGSAGAAFIQGAEIASQFMYGVRVLVDGAWASAHGIRPTADALTSTARAAVATARGYAQVNGANHAFASAPVVTGTWETPTLLDPFTVPLGDQAALLSACTDAIRRVRHAIEMFPGFAWIRETRVFASSEGAALTQTRRTFETEFAVLGILLSQTSRGVTLPGLWPASGGYECVTRPDLQDELKCVAEEAARLRMLPRGHLEVGRYPIVVDAPTFGTLFIRTMGAALELDRSLGDEDGTGGGSYLSPPETMLGNPVANALLSVTANRALPSITAAKWDDEGIETREFPLMHQGQLVNYCSSRQTAPRLQTAISAQHQRLANSTGCAMAVAADDPVLVRLPHVTITPNSTRATLEDLCKDITHGVLLRNTRYVSVDPQCATGFLDFPGAMLEIERGKIVRRLEGNGLQFSTPRLWRESLAALGDTTTVASVARTANKGQPESLAWSSTCAPAGFFKEVDVISTRVHL